MFKRALVLLAALMVLSACGYRGALTLPQDTPEEANSSSSAPAEQQQPAEDK